ncbi:MAG: MFS transporter [Oceanipulchritudo sp.]
MRAQKAPGKAVRKAPQVAPEDRVPLRKRIAYGAGGLATGIQDRFDNGVMNPVFVVGVGFSPIVMSSCGAFYRVYDAFSDIFMGSISDNTRTRWGRRRPYVFAGAFLMAFAMPWLFQFNPAWSLLTIGVWMVIFNLLIQTTQTIYNVPYQSLLIESTPDTNERTNVSAWRAYVGIFVGVAVSWTWWLAQRPLFHVNGEPDVLNGIKWLVIMAAIPVALLGILPAIFMEERFYKEAKDQAKIKIKDSIRFAFTNKPFLLLITFIFVYVGGTGLHWGLVFYVKLFYVCGGDQGLASEIAGWQGTVQAFFSVVGIPLAQRLAASFGKMKTIVIAMVCFFFASGSTWFLLTPEAPYLSIVPFVLMGPVVTMIWVVIPSMLGDVVDYEEHRNGHRSEGIFSSVFSWMLKVAQTVSTFLSGPIVVWAGYEAAKRHELAQNLEVLTRMRILLMAIPSTFIMIAAIILWFYPLNADRVQELRTDLENRRGKM